MTWEDNYLAHHGVPNQKWGVRRYQNEDGSYTEEGKKHYGIGENEGAVKKSKEEIRTAYNNRRFSKDEQKLYNIMTEENKRAVDARMAKGESAEQAIRNTAKSLSKQAILNKGLKSYGLTFLLGTGARALGTAVSARHPVVGAFIRSYGKGTQLGSAIGGATVTGAHFIMQSRLNNVKMSDLAEFAPEFAPEVDKNKG